MANYEIESFVTKFKALCRAGRSACLTISSDAGKATLNLSVDLGVLPDEGLHHPHHPHLPRNPSRNGPSRQRRREKRAAARSAQAEQAEAALNVEEKEMLEIAEKAASNSPVQKPTVPAKGSEEIEAKEEVTVEETKTSDTEIVDEVCPDSVYESTTPDEPEADPNPRKVTAVHLKPPPVRDRGIKDIGGIKYYTLTYEDFSDDEDEIC